jgi:hypothetical protein
MTRPVDRQSGGTQTVIRTPAMFSRRGIVRGVLTMALVFVGYLAVLTLLDLPFTPWARSFGMWPTLTGDWSGELRTEGGRPHPVFFAVRGGWRRRSVYINGRGRLCERDGAIRDFEISGRPDNWSGSRFHLSTRGVVEHGAGTQLGELEAEWQGDAIRATGALVSAGPVATASVSRDSRPAAPPKVHYSLRRGSEKDFLTACKTETGRD